MPSSWELVAVGGVVVGGVGVDVVVLVGGVVPSVSWSMLVVVVAMGDRGAMLVVVAMGDGDGMALAAVTSMVVVVEEEAAVIPPSAVTASVAVTAPIAAAPNAISPAANAIGLPVLYAPGYALPPSRPDNAILPPGNLITAIYGYHIPPPNAGSPFFCGSHFTSRDHVTEGHRRMAAALTANFALYLT
ncbi:uncharacterized protein LACBIDRAFT_327889 [Laccaria bicolor S238N-H82]|uniref:Predicted protein n=1 Tax=Laccaria bicolor (strain S238N-H82 / ATCC MYA-4686) TaxID=486041 RepID=B0DD49_LACBS|nr:uncharacterized protein LACBIDRAFT_327889 [Laccaria bicolor S238N-H82]EDR07414.1 predicted protein [Laccaria bicolor S238N-H82]|eukprot:XP_001881806.1 predicted protein [Laccaria bicolor S238N-H82]